MKTILFTIAFWGIFFALPEGTFAQSPPRPKPISAEQNFYGVVEGGKYENRYFGFRLKVPKDYSVLESEEAKLYAKAGVDILKGTEKGTSRRVDAALAHQATLIGILEKPFGTPLNAVVEIVVGKQPQGVTANMALAATSSLMTASTLYKVTRSIDGAKFGGKRFAGVRLDGTYNTVHLTEELYTIIRRGYSVNIAMTYSTEEGRKNMIAVLNSLEFID